MNRKADRRFIWIAICCVVIVFGCSSRPRAVSIPKYDPEQFANSILERCDKDTNGQLSKVEAGDAPGILASWSRYDRNKDGNVSREELERRAREWVERGDGLVQITCNVKVNGVRTSDVHVKLIPDESLSDIILPAEATSLSNRPSFLNIPPSLKDPSHKNLTGMQYGLYRIEVSNSKGPLAVEELSQGCDIGLDDQVGGITVNLRR